MSAFKIDFLPEAVLEWHRTETGLSRRRVTEYTRTWYIDGPPNPLKEVANWLDSQEGVLETEPTSKRLSLAADRPTEILKIETAHTADPATIARRLRREVELPTFSPGTLRYYNVDLAPQFRYCLETGVDPHPEGQLSTLSIALDEKSIADRDLTNTSLEGDSIEGGESAVLEAVEDALDRTDPDVLVLTDAELVPLLSERALAHGIDLQLGRQPGWEQLAGENTFESYGRVGYSAPRYTIPGRVLIDTSNSFLWPESSLAGLLYLVRRSQKPLQETAWGSIGNILTSIQIRKATERGVVVPWNKWEPETYKPVPTLHDADRGGFIMDPTVGFHEDVYELDFSSLYPSIMCEYNISPDTIGCDCHPDRTVLPGIEYNVCPERGFIVDVLEPLLADREAAKATVREADPETDCRDERAIAGAIKWILVSCFGYQGYRNSKFGRIECHEAINAVARELFLSSKQTLEAGGWEVVHGIVDSVWVTPQPGESPTSLSTLAAEISADAGIVLEREARYDWVAFVPCRGQDRGALTRYVGKKADTDEFKLRGIELRQRSTTAFVAHAQRELLRVLDRTRNPEAVVDRGERYLGALAREAVDPTELVITKRVSKPREAYTQSTHSVAALERAERAGIEKRPGQSVEYIVVDDDATGAERVRLPFEPIETYDVSYYEERLLRATESVLAPLGWDRKAIDRYRRETVDATLSAFTAEPNERSVDSKG